MERLPGGLFHKYRAVRRQFGSNIRPHVVNALSWWQGQPPGGWGRGGDLAAAPRDPAVVPRQQDLRSAIHGAQRYGQSKGSTSVKSVQDAVDTIAAAVKKADKDGDGVVSDSAYKSLATLAAKRFVDFGQVHAKDKVTDTGFSFTPSSMRPSSRSGSLSAPRRSRLQGKMCRS